MDIGDDAAVRARAVGASRPDVVVNTAAFHNVPKCETDAGAGLRAERRRAAPPGARVHGARRAAGAREHRLRLRRRASRRPTSRPIGRRRSTCTASPSWPASTRCSGPTAIIRWCARRASTASVRAARRAATSSTRCTGWPPQQPEVRVVERRGAHADVHRRPGGADPRPGARGPARALPRHQPGQLLLVRVRARHLRPGRPRRRRSADLGARTSRRRCGVRSTRSSRTPRSPPRGSIACGPGATRSPTTWAAARRVRGRPDAEHRIDAGRARGGRWGRIAAALVLAGAAGCTRAPPDVIVILVDTLRADRLAPGGGGRA